MVRHMRVVPLVKVTCPPVRCHRRFGRIFSFFCSSVAQLLESLLRLGVVRVNGLKVVVSALGFLENVLLDSWPFMVTDTKRR